MPLDMPLCFIYMHASYMYNRLNSSRMRTHTWMDVYVYGKCACTSGKNLSTSAKESKRPNAQQAKQLNNKLLFFLSFYNQI